MKYAFFCFVLCCGFLAKGQFPEYCVYLVKGKVLFARPGARSEEVKQKQLLFADDVLTLGEQAAVTLVNRDQQYLSLSKSGTFKVGSLGKEPHSTSKGITRKYLYLLWHELLDPSYDYTKLKAKNIAASWGGASRGQGCTELIFPSVGMKTARDSIPFKWRHTHTQADYQLFIYALNGQELLQLPVKDTQVVLPLSALAQGLPGRYEWVVRGGDSTCESDPAFFEVITKDQEKALTASLVGGKPPAGLAANFTIIDRLERAGLVYAAKSYFLDLVKSTPGDSALAKSYISFLLSYGFEQEADAQWASLVRR